MRDKKGRYIEGYEMPKEMKEKISDTLKGRTPKNIKIFQEAAKTSNLGKKHSEKSKLKMSLAKREEKSYLWKGGISKYYQIGYNSWEYKQWRIKVFERDDYTCQDCGVAGNKSYLTSHHIKSFTYHTKLRFELSNGKTLCENCHEKTDNYKSKAKLDKYKIS